MIETDSNMPMWVPPPLPGHVEIDPLAERKSILQELENVTKIGEGTFG